MRTAGLARPRGWLSSVRRRWSTRSTMYSTISLGVYQTPRSLRSCGVEGFEERLVEVGDGVFFAEGIEEGGLDAVEGFAGEVEDL